MKKLLLILAFVPLFCADLRAERPDSTDYRPHLSGVARVRWEMATDGPEAGDNRFAIRNARLVVSGKVAAPVEYLLRADLCDLGHMKFLDGYVRFRTCKVLSLQAGQFRIPFGIDTFMAPGSYVFANRSFIGRDLANNRAAGLQAMLAGTVGGWNLGLNSGVFSNHSISDHDRWSTKMTVAGRLVATRGPITLAGGLQTLEPDSVRINMADVAATLRVGELTASAEYMYKHYTHDAFWPCHAWLVWADYGLPLRHGLFNRLSFQGRMEGATAHSTGTRNAAGRLTANQPRRQRLTVGTKLSHFARVCRCDLHLNYEKYFYHDGYRPANLDRADKLVAEISIVF